MKKTIRNINLKEVTVTAKRRPVAKSSTDKTKAPNYQDYIGDYPDWTRNGKLVKVNSSVVMDARKVNPNAYPGYESSGEYSRPINAKVDSTNIANVTPTSRIVRHFIDENGNDTIDYAPLPKYNNGISSYGATLGMNANTPWNDYTALQQGSTIATAGLNAFGVGTGVVGGIINSTDTDGRYTKKDAWAGGLSKVGSRVGTLTAAGAAIGGPIGGAIGAGAGIALGTIESIDEANKMLKEQAAKDRISSISTGYRTLSNIAMPNNANKNKNLGLPGMDKGVYKFYSNKNSTANAMVASEEAIVSPNGNVEMVPGKYNKSNPDTVKASLSDGTSVLSNNPIFTLPEGKSTPADIGKRIASIQKKGNEIIAKRNTSFIDRNTVNINKKNTDIVLNDKLPLYTGAIKDRLGIQDINSSLPKYDTGLDGSLALAGYKYPSYQFNDQESTGVLLDKYGPGSMIYRPTRSRSISTDSPTIDMSRQELDMWQNAVQGHPNKLIKTAPATNVNATNSTNGTPTLREQNRGFDSNSALKAISMSTAIGSSLSQYSNAIAEDVQPSTYSAFTAKNRSDLYNQLRDIQARENIARYNNRVSSGNTGLSNALNASTQSVSNSAYGKAYDANYKQLMNIDNINRQELSRISNMNIQEGARIRDINMRNKAAARNIKYAAIQDIAKTIYPRLYDPSTSRV